MYFTTHPLRQFLACGSQSTALTPAYRAGHSAAECHYGTVTHHGRTRAALVLDQPVRDGAAVERHLQLRQQAATRPPAKAAAYQPGTGERADATAIPPDLTTYHASERWDMHMQATISDSISELDWDAGVSCGGRWRPGPAHEPKDAAGQKGGEWPDRGEVRAAQWTAGVSGNEGSSLARRVATLRRRGSGMAFPTAALRVGHQFCVLAQ